MFGLTQSAELVSPNIINGIPKKLEAPHGIKIFEEETFKDAALTKSSPDILIVDDNTFNVYSLRLIIEETFFLPCDSAYSAKEALQIIKGRLANGKGVHRLILTDINMPEMDGL